MRSTFQGIYDKICSFVSNASGKQLYGSKNLVILILSYEMWIPYYKLSKKEIMVINLNIVKFALFVLFYLKPGIVSGSFFKLFIDERKAN